MDIVLAGTDSFAAAYLDDVVVYSATWEDHLCHLGEVLQRIQHLRVKKSGVSPALQRT